MSQHWDSSLYSQFLDTRTRPARDLLAAVPADFTPKHIYDLGCGPGNSTALLQQHWPQATVIGIDSSPSMLADAHIRCPDTEFLNMNIADFSPPQSADMLFANASLHWLPNHQQLFSKLVGFLNPGAALAIQMPNNFHAPTHQIVQHLLNTNEDWQPLLKHLIYNQLGAPLFDPNFYYDLLTQLNLTHLQLWETIYQQEMTDHTAILHWVEGSVLRPILGNMSSEHQSHFKKAYVEQISQAYPIQKNGHVLLPFRRFFIVGHRPFRTCQ